MKLIPVFKGEVVNGKLQLFDKLLFDEYLTNFDGVVDVIVKTPNKRRTVQQNKYYRFVLQVISDETGHTDEELHEYYKEAFLNGSEREILGKLIHLYPTTATLTTIEFTEYINKIKRHAADFDINVPDPDECVNWFFDDAKTIVITKDGMGPIPSQTKGE